MRDRARTHPKLHHEDPSGFWKLIRTGTELPVVGQQILFVYDIRGTSEELRHNLLARIANGDPYRLTNDLLEQNGKVLGGAPGAMLAETFKLPTEEYKPTTYAGTVDEVAFDEVMQEHWIAVASGPSAWSKRFSPDCIVYWAPFPMAPDTYTPRPTEFSHTEGLRAREQTIRDRWQSRKLREV